MELNQDILRGKWKQIRGRVKQWRGKLTHSSLDQIVGRFEEQMGLIQEGYGRSRMQPRRKLHGLRYGRPSPR